jgi:hypothetical protein
MKPFFTKYYMPILFLVIGLAVFVRIFGLTTSPPSLYWEEAALGYDAYSIFKTGHDHHGNFLPIFAFESFGDWKPAGYFYAIIPFIAALGLNEWAVRLPAALAGIAIVFAVGYLGKHLKLPILLTIFVAAISPWGIHFSRAGWEVTLATALMTWGAVFLLEATVQQNVQLKKAIWGTILFALAAYTYHATRLLGPILYAAILLQWAIPQIFENTNFLRNFQKVLQQNTKQLLWIFVTIGLLFGPLVVAVLTTPELKQRYNETGNVFDATIITESNELRERAGNSFISRILYHRYVIWSKYIVQQIGIQLSSDYLIVTGDENLRHGTKFFGIIYPTDLLFFAIGLIFIIRNKRKQEYLLLFWLLVTLFITALARPVPQTLRILPALPAFLLIIGIGMYAVYQYLLNLKKDSVTFQYLVVLLFIGCNLVQFGAFWRYYMNVYPHLASNDWQYGYKQVMQELAALQTQNPEIQKIYITREKGRPAMYYWFFAKTDPYEVQKENAIAEKDQAEFTTFKNMYFEKSINEVPEEPLLLVASEEQTKRYLQRVTSKGFQSETLYTVQDLDNKTVWMITQVR